ncbi:MAG TPA: FGGY family carbohydrate kinase, partial [Patescibacteria group bacterium]|nr:FGGY family carbohydrate kinase [Patescibacteria group bacterium]
MNEKSSKNYVIGLDFGTDSVRSLLVDCENGKDISHAVVYYPRWQQGLFCDPDRNQFRHHPLDYLESMEKSLKNCLAQVDDEIKSNIVGISADTTGSTPALVDQEGNVLAQLSEFKRNPNGMFVLWKDHTSVEETEEINQKCKGWGGEDYTKYEGGVYSSEWWWSKILHILRTDEDIRENAFSAIELCDWIPSVLTG